MRYSDGMCTAPDGYGRVEIEMPGWACEVAAPGTVLGSADERMALAVALSRENIRHGGGPFGAAVFEIGTGRLVAPGMNLVVPCGNCVLHAEVVALMFAQRARGTYTLADGPACELVTSCEPCAMCLGATLWSGVKRLVCGATRDDAMSCGFDEGPVFDASYRYLEDRGVEIVRGVGREEAAAVLRDYAGGGGTIYNG